MPKQTFFNLAAEKRTRILDAAIAELGSKPFDKVNIADIIEKAGIPRGSFYQYFVDLKDLYRYIFKLIAEKKLVYLRQVIAGREDLDFFQTIRELYAAGLRFAAENPRLAAVGNYYYREDRSFKQEMFPDMEEQGRKFFAMLLARGQARGEVDPKIDLKLASALLYYLTNDITGYYLEEAQEMTELLSGKGDNYLELVD
ncbi:MAG TPA: TetR/AcrR family transcriptional regulator, partial [Firmicutes bacterium]|nr:TetR/AcrR family transcriptional regulator [Bacillota bacterium]